MTEYHKADVNHGRMRELADKNDPPHLRVERTDTREAKGAPETFPEYVLSRAARLAAVASALSKRNIQDFGKDNRETNELRAALLEANQQLVPFEIMKAVKTEYEHAARLLDDEELNLVVIDSSPVMVPVIEEAVTRQKAVLAEGIDTLEDKIQNFVSRTEGDAMFETLQQFEEADFFVSEFAGPRAQWEKFMREIATSGAVVAATGSALTALPSTVSQGFDRPSEKARDPLYAPENIATALRVIEKQLSPMHLIGLRMRVDARYGRLLETLKEATPKENRDERYEAKKEEYERARDEWRAKISGLGAFRKQLSEAIDALVDIDEDAREFIVLRKDILDAEAALDRAQEIRSIPERIAELARQRGAFFKQRMLREGATLDWVSEEYRQDILTAHAEVAKFFEHLAEEWEGFNQPLQMDTEETERTRVAQQGGR